MAEITPPAFDQAVAKTLSRLVPPDQKELNSDSLEWMGAARESGAYGATNYSAIGQMAIERPDQVRADIGNDLLPEAINVLRLKLKHGSIGAARTVFRLVKLLDMKQEATVILFQQLGMPLDQAKLKLTAVKQAERMDDDELWERFLAFAPGYLSAHPDAASRLSELISPAGASVPVDPPGGV